MISEHQLQRVLAWCEGLAGFSLTTTKVQNLLGLWQRQGVAWYTGLIDQQMMMSGTGQIRASRCNTHAFQSKSNHEGARYTFTINRADEVNLSTCWRH